jgi:hypothetical protein
LASFRKIASALFGFLLEHYAVGPALSLDELYSGALKRVLDADDCRDMALRGSLHLLNTGNRSKARFGGLSANSGHHQSGRVSSIDGEIPADKAIVTPTSAGHSS